MISLRFESLSHAELRSPDAARSAELTTNARVALLVLLGTLACSGQQERKPQPTRRLPDSLANSSIDDVVPLIHGGAYASGLDGIWYLSNKVAVRVHPVGDSAAVRRYTEDPPANIVSTIDGTAYAWGLADGIWRLSADSASVVEEQSAPTHDSTRAEAGVVTHYYATLYSREHQLRRKAQQELDEAQHAQDETDPPERPAP